MSQFVTFKTGIPGGPGDMC